MRLITKGEALCFAFLFSANAMAQAPVTDVSAPQAAVQVGSVGPTSITTLEQRLAVLERIVQSRNSMQQQLQVQLDSMQSEVDELRGSVELHTNQLEKVLQRQRELYLEIDKRVDALKSVAVKSNVPVSNEQQVSATPQLGESDAYDKAVNLILKTREYDKAIPAFQSFLQAYPASEFADNAHYWLGQLLFNKQRWSEAEESFLTVVNRFTDSTKRADAMLKLGVIKQQTGVDSDATSWFQRVINEYPNSSAAKLAQSRLQ